MTLRLLRQAAGEIEIPMRTYSTHRTQKSEDFRRQQMVFKSLGFQMHFVAVSTSHGLKRKRELRRKRRFRLACRMRCTELSAQFVAFR